MATRVKSTFIERMAILAPRLQQKARDEGTTLVDELLEWFKRDDEKAIQTALKEALNYYADQLTDTSDWRRMRTETGREIEKEMLERNCQRIRDIEKEMKNRGMETPVYRGRRER